MRGQGSVDKRCGCVNPADGREVRPRCPQLAKRGHGCWYFDVELPPARDGSRLHSDAGKGRMAAGVTRLEHVQTRRRWSKVVAVPP
jgi:hypothetical protein